MLVKVGGSSKQQKPDCICNRAFVFYVYLFNLPQRVDNRCGGDDGGLAGAEPFLEVSEFFPTAVCLLEVVFYAGGAGIDFGQNKNGVAGGGRCGVHGV